MFVSHSAVDYDVVRAILLRYEVERFLTFHIANRAQPPAFVKAYKPQIIMNLQRCAWFIVAVSEAALRSQWVRFEVTWALRHKPRNRILCLLVDKSDPTSLSNELSEIRTINVRPLLADTNPLLAKVARWRVTHALPRGTFDEFTKNDKLWKP